MAACVQVRADSSQAVLPPSTFLRTAVRPTYLASSGMARIRRGSTPPCAPYLRNQTVRLLSTVRPPLRIAVQTFPLFHHHRAGSHHFPRSLVHLEMSTTSRALREPRDGALLPSRMHHCRCHRPACLPLLRRHRAIGLVGMAYLPTQDKGTTSGRRAVLLPRFRSLPVSPRSAVLVAQPLNFLAIRGPTPILCLPPLPISRYLGLVDAAMRIHMPPRSFSRRTVYPQLQSLSCLSAPMDR